LEEKNQRRSEERRIFTTTFEFKRNPLPGANPVERNLSGIIANRSERGLGFYSSLPLDAGEEITIFCHEINSAPMRARVRWCSKFSTDLFKTGVSFV
jgi:hypothetical protein